MTNTEILNSAALASLEEMASGDSQFIAELIDTWMSDAAGQIAAIEQALVTGDADTLRRAAHTLKSTSQSLGASQLAGACAQIEARAKQGEMDGTSGLVSDLRGCYEQTCAALLVARSAA